MASIPPFIQRGYDQITVELNNRERNSVPVSDEIFCWIRARYMADFLWYLHLGVTEYVLDQNAESFQQSMFEGQEEWLYLTLIFQKRENPPELFVGIKREE